MRTLGLRVFGSGPDGAGDRAIMSMISARRRSLTWTSSSVSVESTGEAFTCGCLLLLFVFNLVSLLVVYLGCLRNLIFI